MVFYVWGGRVAIVLVLVSIAANFVLGQAIAAADAERRTRLIRWSVAGNLLVLIVFKYADFLVDNVNVVLDAIRRLETPRPASCRCRSASRSSPSIIISYLVDVYRGTAEAQRSPVPFALYILNFPQLVAGPIIRYRPMAPQLARRDDRVRGHRRRRHAVRRRASAKKLLIANPLGAVADQLFAIEPSGLPTWALWLAVVCYALQIYFDFSGYSDMAIGIARMFGFRFPENFNYPYSATSIQDFWRRWHITLSAWFRDYVYVPLGGNRGSLWRTTINLWIVFLLCGAWHGASWNFIVWGMWHGLFLSIERIGVVQRLLASLPSFVRTAYVLLIVSDRLGVLPPDLARSCIRDAVADVRPGGRGGERPAGFGASSAADPAADRGCHRVRVSGLARDQGAAWRRCSRSRARRSPTMSGARWWSAA